MKKTIMATILLLVAFPLSVYATSLDSQTKYTNANGIEMTEAQYNKLAKHLNPYFIEHLTEKEFEKELNTTRKVVDSSVKYVATTYYMDKNKEVIGVDEYEITEQEFNNFEAISALTNNRRSGYDYTYHDTNAKRLYMEGYYPMDDNQAEIFVQAVWKVNPTYKSFDDIGVRFRTDKFALTDAWGYQTYRSGEIGMISYGYNGNNMVLFNGPLFSGVGISMNLLNDITGTINNISPFYYVLELFVRGNTVPASIGDNYIHSSYQHAIQNINLATAQSYTISSLGLGGVFYFNPLSLEDKFDQMPGVDITL